MFACYRMPSGRPARFAQRGNTCGYFLRCVYQEKGFVLFRLFSPLLFSYVSKQVGFQRARGEPTFAGVDGFRVGVGVPGLQRCPLLGRLVQVSNGKLKVKAPRRPRFVFLVAPSFSFLLMRERVLFIVM